MVQARSVRHRRRGPVRARKTSSSVALCSANAATRRAVGVELVEQRAHVRGAAVGGDARARSRAGSRARARGRRARARPRRTRRASAQRRGPARWSATRRLSSAGRALGDDAAAVETAMRSASRSASSRYWVVRKTVTPSSDELRRPRPTSPGGCAGRGPSVGSSRKRTAGRADEAGGEVEAPAHPAGVGADAPAAGVDEVEAIAAARARGRGAARDRPGSRPIMRRFSSPVCSSSTAAYWPVRLIARRTRRRSATTSSPATRAVPASARAAWRGSARSWSCRRRSGRAARRRCRGGRAGRRRRARTLAVGLAEARGLYGLSSCRVLHNLRRIYTVDLRKDTQVTTESIHALARSLAAGVGAASAPDQGPEARPEPRADRRRRRSRSPTPRASAPSRWAAWRASSAPRRCRSTATSRPRTSCSR